MDDINKNEEFKNIIIYSGTSDSYFDDESIENLV